ncbi:MAG: hypothetical protein HDT18_03870 [Oscillibacter sp.]|nr:hypothetical protein [Oscillibacter sp.]
MMENDCRWGKLLGITLGLILPLFAGCGFLPDLIPGREEAAGLAKLEISLDAAMPEGVTVTWDPSLVTVDSAEVNVGSDAEGEGSRMAVTVELRPVEK